VTYKRASSWPPGAVEFIDPVLSTVLRRAAARNHFLASRKAAHRPSTGACAVRVRFVQNVALSVLSGFAINDLRRVVPVQVRKNYRKFIRFNV